MTGERWNDDAGERKGECSSESERDGGRSSTGDDVYECVGEPAALRRAAISLNAATEMRCAVSDVVLSPLGRGCAGGIRREELLSSPPTCRNDLRLNESPLVSRLGGAVGGGGSEPFFLRSRWAHENSPDGFFGGAGGSTGPLLFLRPPSVFLRGGTSMLPLCGAGGREASVRSVGSDRVERALWGSP